MVGVSARAVADFSLVGDVRADDRRSGGHGLVGIDDGRQFLVFHFDRRGAIRGRIAVAGDTIATSCIWKHTFLSASTACTSPPSVGIQAS